jgi:hypothetical protein
MDKELVDAFILECKQEQEWKERFKANHIEFDNYFKYSGEVEPDTREYAMYIENKKTMTKWIANPLMKNDHIRPKDIYLLLTAEEGLMVDIFYKYADKLNMEQMAKKIGRSKDYFKKTIGKHLKIMRDDKNNAIRGLPRLKKFKWEA